MDTFLFMSSLSSELGSPLSDPSATLPRSLSPQLSFYVVCGFSRTTYQVGDHCVPACKREARFRLWSMTPGDIIMAGLFL